MGVLLTKNPEILWKEIDGEVVLLNPKSGDYFGLNSVGASFWERVGDGGSMDDITTILLEEFEVEEAILRNDLEDLIKKMEEKNLLTVNTTG